MRSRALPLRLVRAASIEKIPRNFHGLSTLEPPRPFLSRRWAGLRLRRWFMRVSLTKVYSVPRRSASNFIMCYFRIAGKPPFEHDCNSYVCNTKFVLNLVLQVDRVQRHRLLFSGVLPQALASLRPEVRIAESVHWQSKGDDRDFVILSTGFRKNLGSHCISRSCVIEQFRVVSDMITPVMFGG